MQIKKLKFYCLSLQWSFFTCFSSWSSYTLYLYNSLSFFKITFIYLCWEGMHVPERAFGGQRTTFESQLPFCPVGSRESSSGKQPWGGGHCPCLMTLSWHCQLLIFIFIFEARSCPGPPQTLFSCLRPLPAGVTGLGLHPWLVSRRPLACLSCPHNQEVETESHWI